jgi:hypothetical protein
MAVTREQFEKGMTYDAYKAQMTRNREQVEKNEAGLKVADADLAVFRGLPKPLNVLALAEDWCGDVVANLPILGRLEKESQGKLNVRVLLRDQNLDVMDQYLKDGKYQSIPLFVFLDEAFNEVGMWQERPDSVTELREQKRQELYASDPAYGSPKAPLDQLPEEVRTRLQAAIRKMREDTAEYANGEVLRELKAVVQQAATRVGAGAR